MKNVFLHPGDKVIITKYISGINYHAGFACGMRKYCGQVMTIESIEYLDAIPEHRLYHLKEDLDGYVWSIDMFDPFIKDSTFLNLKLFI